MARSGVNYGRFLSDLEDFQRTSYDRTKLEKNEADYEEDFEPVKENLAPKLGCQQCLYFSDIRDYLWSVFDDLHSFQW